MKKGTVPAVLAVLVLALPGCSIQDKIEQAVEDEVATAISEAVEDMGPVETGMSIPEGYPLDDFPVYGGSDSEVMGGSRQSLEGMLMYNLVIGTSDSPEAVEAAIREEYEGRSSEFEQMVGGGMFTGLSGQWRFSIVINDGQADGFASVVSYMLQGE